MALRTCFALPSPQSTRYVSLPIVRAMHETFLRRLGAPDDVPSHVTDMLGQPGAAGDPVDIVAGVGADNASADAVLDTTAAAAAAAAAAAVSGCAVADAAAVGPCTGAGGDAAALSASAAASAAGAMVACEAAAGAGRDVAAGCAAAAAVDACAAAAAASGRAVESFSAVKFLNVLVERFLRSSKRSKSALSRLRFARLSTRHSYSLKAACHLLAICTSWWRTYSSLVTCSSSVTSVPSG